ncbi:hypothetical protein [Candidatus Lokiarchaeum ossiferum]|uniref:hypothetical protein n=1 Tax=Candidatus Lokiarchaeum ossiferum TaxID=2951803 RepID=UPI00352CD299
MKAKKRQILIVTTLTLLLFFQNVNATSESPLGFSEGTQLVWRIDKTTTTNGTDVEEKTVYQLLNISKIVEDSTTVNVTFTPLESNETITATNIKDANWTDSELFNSPETSSYVFNRSIDGGELFPFFCLLDSDLSEIKTFNDTSKSNILTEIAWTLSSEFFLHLFIMSLTLAFSEDSELTNSSQIVTNTDTKLIGSIFYNLTSYSSITKWKNMTTKVLLDLNYDPISKVLVSGDITTLANYTSWNETLTKYVSTDMIYRNEYQLIAPKSLDSTPTTTTTTSTNTTSTDETSTSSSTNSTIETSHGEESGIQGILDAIPGWEGYHLVGFSILGIVILFRTKKYQ